MRNLKLEPTRERSPYYRRLRHVRVMRYKGHRPSMSSFMNPAEFANIARSERDFWWYRGMRDIFFRMVDPFLRDRKIHRALEAGCGTGYFSHLLQTDHRWPVVPMDIGWEGLRHARAMQVEKLVQADMVRLPFGGSAFDLVLSLDVLPHLPRGEEHRAAKEFARVLSPGGLLVLRASALDLLRSRHSTFVGERQRFERRRLLRVMADAGLRVLRCTYANSFLMPIALLKFRILEPLLGQRPTSGVHLVSPWLDRLLYRPLAMEARWLGGGHNLPIGQTLIFIGEKIG